MANTIARAEKYLPLIDQIYKRESLSAVLDGQTLDWNGADTVRIMKVEGSGLGDYSRATGYPAGDVTVAWEVLRLAEERGKEISIDRMDDEETLGMAFGAAVNDLLTNHAAPEMDAYRFAKYASTANIGTDSAALTEATILGAIDEAAAAMDSAEVPETGRILFVSSAMKNALAKAVNRQWGSDATINTYLQGYNDMRIIYVPQSRFYSAVTMNSGASAWGYSKGVDAKNINFMMVHPSAVIQAVKFALPKIFSPDENQTKDAWKLQFRQYHDAFVLDNKVKGVFAHVSTT